MVESDNFCQILSERHAEAARESPTFLGRVVAAQKVVGGGQMVWPLRDAKSDRVPVLCPSQTIKR